MRLFLRIKVQLQGLDILEQRQLRQGHHKHSGDHQHHSPFKIVQEAEFSKLPGDRLLDNLPPSRPRIKQSHQNEEKPKARLHNLLRENGEEIKQEDKEDISAKNPVNYSIH